MSDVTYTYFRILALSDLISLLFTISVLVHILNPLTEVYSTAAWYSYAELYFTNVPMSVSVFLVICITIDRFFCICRPVEFKTIHTRKNAKYGIFGSMITAILIWLPICFIKNPILVTQCEDYKNFEHINRTLWVSCVKKEATTDYYLVYSWIRQIMTAFIPIFVLMILNILIIHQFKIVIKTRENMRRTSVLMVNNPNAVKAAEDKNLIVLLISIMISFFVTMLPPGIFNGIYTLLEISDLDAEIFRAVANNLEILNHSLNFYLYILLSKPIRRCISKYIQSKRISISSCSSTLVTDFQKKFSLFHKNNTNDVEQFHSYLENVLPIEPPRSQNRNQEKTKSAQTISSDLEVRSSSPSSTSEHSDQHISPNCKYKTSANRLAAYENNSCQGKIQNICESEKTCNSLSYDNEINVHNTTPQSKSSMQAKEKLPENLSKMNKTPVFIISNNDMGNHNQCYINTE